MKLLAANWKMKGDLPLCQAFAQQLSEHSARLKDKLQILICPPTPYLGHLSRALRDTATDWAQIGAQDISRLSQQGAHTGEVHSAVLTEVGCSHVIVGHSERRQFMGEDNATTGQKMLNCLRAGLTPVLCIGESAEQRSAGASEEVIGQQLAEAFAACSSAEEAVDLPTPVLAYEPFWAIGSGQAAEPETITAMHSFIRTFCIERLGLPRSDLQILYGGSVKRDNVEQIAALDEVDGGLIGGASLDATHFCELALAFAK